MFTMRLCSSCYTVCIIAAAFMLDAVASKVITKKQTETPRTNSSKIRIADAYSTSFPRLRDDVTIVETSEGRPTHRDQPSPKFGYRYDIEFPPALELQDKFLSSSTRDSQSSETRAISHFPIQNQPTSVGSYANLRSNSIPITASKFGSDNNLFASDIPSSGDTMTLNEHIEPQASGNQGYIYDKPINEFNLLSDSVALDAAPLPLHNSISESNIFHSTNIPPYLDTYEKAPILMQDWKDQFLNSATNLQQSIHPNEDNRSRELGSKPVSFSVRFTSSDFAADGIPVSRFVEAKESEEGPVDYSFAYTIRGDPTYGHAEDRNEDTASGKYFVGLPDGRIQLVEYTVDEGGYHPSITYRLQSDPSTQDVLNIL